MRVYHGTAGALASSILERGLRPAPNAFRVVYVTTDRRIATAYSFVQAEHFIDHHDGAPEGAIATAEVRRHALARDPHESKHASAWIALAPLPVSSVDVVPLPDLSQARGETLSGACFWCPVCEERVGTRLIGVVTKSPWALQPALGGVS